MFGEVTRALKANGFTPIELIGIGGFAKVFKVTWDQYPGRIFAAKVISLSGYEDEERTSTYINEINCLKMLGHQNVIYIFKHFKYESNFYIILEYCKNGSYLSLIKNLGTLNYEGFRMVAKQCLDALNYCHTHGVVHLDIKPANILLGDKNQTKLSDFGLSNMILDNGMCETRRATFIYSAPERFLRSPFNPFKADIWSMGITFYYFVTGKYPWEVETKKEAMNSIINSPVVYPEDIHPNIKELIDFMLIKDPLVRPSATELLKFKIFQPHTSIMVSDVGKNCAASTIFKNTKLVVGSHSHRESIRKLFSVQNIAVSQRRNSMNLFSIKQQQPC